MDTALGLTLLQEGLPPLIVACALGWLGWRWLRPARASACAGCEQALPRASVRHRLRVLAPDPAKQP